MRANIQSTRKRLNENPDDIIEQLRNINSDSGIDGRFVPNKRSYQVKTMNDRHHEIARLHAVGYKNKDIARMLNITDMSVSQVVNSSVVKLKLDTLRGQRDAETIQVMDTINDMLPDAVKIFEGIINGGTVHNDTQAAALQQRTAKDLLGMGGIAPIKQTINRQVSTVLTADEIKALCADADRIGIIHSDPIDCDYTVVEEDEDD